MATNKSKAKPALKPTNAKHDPNALEVAKKTDETKAGALARKVIMPSVTGAVTMQAFKKKFGEVDLMALIEATEVQIQAVQDGDVKRTESMLITQAHTLDAIFNELALRAALNMGEYIGAMETYMRVALKAQSQCRATLETLAEIKNPPVIFAKQANINQGNGNQQVNNGAPTSALASHAEKNINQQNELLEVQHGSETMDIRTAGAAIGKNPAMATVG